MRRMITDKLTKNIKEIVAAYQAGEIETVVANPTMTGTEANLTGLQVGDTKYAVPQGGGGSQLYAHSIMITGSDSTSGDNFIGVAYLISQDSTAITKDNIITKLIAAGYDSSAKRIIFTGTIYVATDTKFCALTYLARNTNSNTNLRVGFVSQAQPDAITNASIQIDITSADVTFLVTDTVITL